MKSYNSIYSLFTAPPTMLTSMNLRKQLTTFAAIGVLNTAVNITHCTATIGRHHFNHRSYALNRQFTFKTSRHQHQSDVEFCVVPNRISRNKEKTPPQKCLFLAPAAGLEPATYWLTANRSTTELCRNMSCIIASF